MRRNATASCREGPQSRRIEAAAVEGASKTCVQQRHAQVEEAGKKPVSSGACARTVLRANRTAVARLPLVSHCQPHEARQMSTVGCSDALRVASLVAVATALCVFSACPGCPTEPDPASSVDVTDLYFAAWRNPETFDTYLTSVRVDSQASRCLREFGEKALRASQEQLAKCAQMVSYTPQWEDCHEERENLNNQGVVFLNIASAVDGQTRFSATEAYQLLTLGKAVAGASAWNQLIDQLRATTPRLECKW